LLAGAVIFAATGVHAHEPVFSLGPHTLYEGGTGIVTTYDARKANGKTDQTPSLGLAYGITPHLQLGASVPYRITPNNDGIGDAAVALKWRFWRKYGKGWLNSAAIQGLLKLPSGKQKPGLSTGAAAYDLALTWGYESLRWYAFSTVQYATFDAGLSAKPGDVAMGALVGGSRLWIPEYEEPDLVLLVELLSGWQGAAAAESLPNTASAAGAPGFRPLHSGGIDIPVATPGGMGKRAYVQWAPEALFS